MYESPGNGGIFECIMAGELKLELDWLDCMNDRSCGQSVCAF